MKSWTERLMAPARVEVKPAPISIAGVVLSQPVVSTTPSIG